MANRLGGTLESPLVCKDHIRCLMRTVNGPGLIYGEGKIPFRPGWVEGCRVEQEEKSVWWVSGKPGAGFVVINEVKGGKRGSNFQYSYQQKVSGFCG